MSLFLIIYLAGFVGFETKAIIDYNDESKKTRVISKGETLAADTVGAALWPAQAVVIIKDKLDGDE